MLTVDRQIVARIAKWGGDAMSDVVESCTFEGPDCRTQAERWARKALARHREASAYPDDLYGWLAEYDTRFGEPFADAQFFDPQDDISWEG